MGMSFDFTRRLVALIGLLAGVACALAFACKSAAPEQDAGDVLEAGMRGGPVVGAVPGQPFGNCPDGSDCAGSTWQQMRTNFLQQIAMKLDAAAGAQAVIQLDDAGNLVLGQHVFPPVDGGFPSGTTSQVLVETSGGPGFASMIGDLRCVSSGSNYTCTIVAIQGVPLDGGGATSGYVLTTDGGAAYWAPQASTTYGVDLAACDAGQCVVAVHGPDGGVVPWFTPGIQVDRGQPGFTLAQAAPPDAATAPSPLAYLPAAPNPAASTTSAGTPAGEVHYYATPLSTGIQPSDTWYFLGDGGAGSGYPEVQIGFAPSSGGTITFGQGAGSPITSSTEWTVYGNGAGYASLNAANNASGLTAGIVRLQTLGSNAFTCEQEGTFLFCEVGGGGEFPGGELLQFPYDQSVQIGSQQQVSNVASLAGNVYGENGYGGGGATQSGGGMSMCGGNHSPAGGSNGFAGLGSGNTTSGNLVTCNEGVTWRNNQLTFLAESSTSDCGSNGEGAITSNGSNEPGYCDGSGAFKTFDSISGGCTSAITQLSGDVTTSAASGCAVANSYVSTIRGGGGGTAEVEVSLQMDDVSPQGAGSGHGFLFGWGGTTNQSGGGYGSWVGAGGHITEFAPSGTGTIGSQNAHTLTDVFYATTTANSQVVAINAPVPIHTTGTITFYVSARVVTAGATSSVDDSFVYITDALVNNASGTPAQLTTNAALRQTISYSTSQSSLLSGISTNAGSGYFGVEAEQEGSPDVGAHIAWTLKYVVDLN